MSTSLSRSAVARVKNPPHRPESPLAIDAEKAMNAIALLDDAIRAAVRAKLGLVDGIRSYQPHGPRKGRAA